MKRLGTKPNNPLGRSGNWKNGQTVLFLPHKDDKNMRTFPYDLMYLNQERGGVGISRFSDTVSIDKLAELFRTHRRGNEVAAAAKRVLERALRAQDLYLQESDKANIRLVKGNQHWLRRRWNGCRNKISTCGVAGHMKILQA